MAASTAAIDFLREEHHRTLDALRTEVAELKERNRGSMRVRPTQRLKS
jgi:hypothetical protein